MKKTSTQEYQVTYWVPVTHFASSQELATGRVGTAAPGHANANEGGLPAHPGRPRKRALPLGYCETLLDLTAPIPKRPRSARSSRGTRALVKPAAPALPTQSVAPSRHASSRAPTAATNSDKWIHLGLELYDAKQFLPALGAFGMATAALRKEAAPVQRVAKAIMTSARMCCCLQEFGAASTLFRESIGLQPSRVAFNRLAHCQRLVRQRTLVPEQVPSFAPGER